jgi:hypothetical protein
MFFEIVFAGLFLMLVWWMFKSGVIWLFCLIGIGIFLYNYNPPL